MGSASARRIDSMLSITARRGGNYDQEVWDLPAERTETIADLESHGGIGTSASPGGAENLAVALYDVQLRDVEAATLRLKTTPVDGKSITDVAAAAMDRALLAEERGDLKAAAHELTPDNLAPPSLVPAGAVVNAGLSVPPLGAAQGGGLCAQVASDCHRQRSDGGNGGRGGASSIHPRQPGSRAVISLI